MGETSKPKGINEAFNGIRFGLEIDKETRRKRWQTLGKLKQQVRKWRNYHSKEIRDIDSED